MSTISYQMQLHNGTERRLAGTYLIGKYLKLCDGTAKPDWQLKEIHKLYRKLKVVNLALMKRIRQASREDASINVMQTFVSITSIIETGVDDIIDKMIPVLRKGI
jgi:6-phosphogluconate dehydrogenase (decarboxylating)